MTHSLSSRLAAVALSALLTGAGLGVISQLARVDGAALLWAGSTPTPAQPATPLA
ncbi:MAG: hypothetical protein KGL18_16110 [Burkholderiales bacterium]|nr:hypothetical protein [Burkholderiales bacterium]MDE2157564.1 hypothetical protein [Burkholderiales bacterium]MDE2504489.1 hypothetical protein [Burkholderiales bacterium]